MEKRQLFHVKNVYKNEKKKINKFKWTYGLLVTIIKLLHQELSLSFKSKGQFLHKLKKQNNFIIITKKSICPFKHNYFGFLIY